MKIKNLGLLLIFLGFFSCVSIPKETITLSHTLGSDIKVLHNSHQNLVHIYYGKIKEEINSFVDEVYAPFVIHHALKNDLNEYKVGNTSLFGTIKLAGENNGEKESKEALQIMMEFQEAARIDIENERNDLLKPILKQESEIISAINQSYERAINANSSITNYLTSIRKIKDTQNQALSILGINGFDTIMTNSLVNLSDEVDLVIKSGKKIDMQSDDAYEQLKKVSNQLKKITNKK